jgi:hypothetical protein
MPRCQRDLRNARERIFEAKIIHDEVGEGDRAELGSAKVVSRSEWN